MPCPPRYFLPTCLMQSEWKNHFVSKRQETRSWKRQRVRPERRGMSGLQSSVHRWWRERYAKCLIQIECLALQIHDHGWQPCRRRGCLAFGHQNGKHQMSCLNWSALHSKHIPTPVLNAERMTESVCGEKTEDENLKILQVEIRTEFQGLPLVCRVLQYKNGIPQRLFRHQTEQMPLTRKKKLKQDAPEIFWSGSPLKAEFLWDSCWSMWRGEDQSALEMSESFYILEAGICGHSTTACKSASTFPGRRNYVAPARDWHVFCNSVWILCSESSQAETPVLFPDWLSPGENEFWHCSDDVPSNCVFVLIVPRKERIIFCFPIQKQNKSQIDSMWLHGPNPAAIYTFRVSMGASVIFPKAWWRRKLLKLLKKVQTAFPVGFSCWLPLLQLLKFILLGIRSGTARFMSMRSNHQKRLGAVTEKDGKWLESNA